METQQDRDYSKWLSEQNELEMYSIWLRTIKRSTSLSYIEWVEQEYEKQTGNPAPKLQRDDWDKNEQSVT